MKIAEHGSIDIKSVKGILRNFNDIGWPAFYGQKGAIPLREAKRVQDISAEENCSSQTEHLRA